MIGCRARALSKILTIDHTELEHARWFDKDEVDLITKKRNSMVKLAREGTIANFLIKDWLNDNS